MKTMKKALALCLALAMVVTAVPVTTAEAAVNVSLSQKTVTVAGNATKKLTKSVKVITKVWTGVKVTASSADKTIATVKVSGKTVKVTGVKKGTTKVTVKVTGKKGAKSVSKKLGLTVKVLNPSVKASAPAEIVAGETGKVTVTTVPSAAKPTFSVDDEKVATVSADGVITAVAPGTAVVSVQTDYGKTTSVTVKVTEKKSNLAIDSFKATYADTLEATFAAPIDTENVTLALKRGTTSVEYKPTWNEDKTVLTLKTSAKMAAGTYELTVTDKNDDTNTVSKTTEVTKQVATEIVILNSVALTGKKPGTPALDAGYAYVYYDVLDQYGESVRTSVNLTWSSSAHIDQKNSALGMLRLDRSDNKDFTFGEQIFISAVCTNPTLTKTATLTVGAKQNVNSVEIGGFLKAGTTDILDSLPADFKDSEYYMLYTIFDQNGNPVANRLKSDGTAYKKGDAIEDITFASSQALIIQEMRYAGADVTIKGDEYHTVLVKPGLKVEDGGEVKVTAVANFTGNQDELIVPVNMSEVLKSFEIGTPADIVADGEAVELPFTAVSTTGQPVTSFKTIAKQETFNKLQFTVSQTGATLKLSEKDDGTAKLVYSDANLGWDDSQTTDGIDRVVSLTAVVVGGETSNQMLSIQDKARPTGISSVNFHSAYVEGDVATVELANDYADVVIKYIDQYNRPLNTAKAGVFFAASAAGQIKGTEFAGYKYGTMLTYVGNDGFDSLKDGGDNAVALEKKVSNDAKDVFLTADINKNKVKIEMSKRIPTAKTGEGWKFGVARLKNANAEYSYIEKTKHYEYTVLDILKVQSITVGNLNKVFVKTCESDNEYRKGSVGEDVITIPVFATDQTFNSTGVTVKAKTDYRQSIKVTGSYAGKNDVRIPSQYVIADATYVGATGRQTDYLGNLLLADVNPALTKTVTDSVDGSFPAADELFYSKSGASTNYQRKDLDDILNVTVREAYSNVTSGSIEVGDFVDDGTGFDCVNTQGIKIEKVAQISKNITISDGAPAGTTLVSQFENIVKNPDKTAMTVNSGLSYNWKQVFVLSDQYGKDISNNLIFEIQDVKETAEGYTTNNFTVSGNDSAVVSIKGAERTDIFKIQASFKKLTASTNVTVGADVQAYINQAGNNYLDTLIGTKTSGGLEQQRWERLQ